MSILSDVQALYASVRGTWAKSRADIIAHVVLVVVVFWICGATIPKVSVATVDPKQLVGNEWFKLAKDTGLLYLSFVIPILLVTVYAALLRTGGQWLVTIVMLIFPPSWRKSQYRLLTPWALEPLALTLQKSDFDLSDLHSKSLEFVLKYQDQKDGQWGKLFEPSITKLTKNSQVYLGDFLVFLLCWIAVFKFLPQVSWVQANEARYWPVVLVLLALALFAWFRVSRALAVLPSMLVMSVSTMIRTDPDMRAALDVSEKKRDSIRGHLEKLLREPQEREDSQPSLLSFIRYKLGSFRKRHPRHDMRQHPGRPFPRLYDYGSLFARHKAIHARYDRQWLAGYFAYLYYRLHMWLSRLAQTLRQLVRLIVTGAP